MFGKTQFVTVSLIEHLVDEAEIEVVTRRELFHRFLQCTDYFYLVCTGRDTNVNEVLSSPSLMVFPVDKERHGLGIVIVAERSVFHILTEAYHGIVVRGSRLVYGEPLIFSTRCFVEYVHVTVAGLKVSPFGDADSHQLEVAVVYGQYIELEMFVMLLENMYIHKGIQL